MTLLPQILLVTGAVAWGLGWLPLHHFASVGLVGMSLVLLVYGALALFGVAIASWISFSPEPAAADAIPSRPDAVPSRDSAEPGA